LSGKDKPDRLDWLGLRREPDYSKARWLGGMITLAVLILIATMVGLTAWEFFRAVSGMDSFEDQVEQSTAIRNSGLVLAAMIGVPFLVWRSFVAQKQVDVAEQGQITDRINKAVEGLGTEKTIKRQRTDPNGLLVYELDSDGSVIFSKPIFEETSEPNIEVRVGAIYALERIAQDSDRDHIQIMEILCAYIRENAPAENAEPFPFDSDKKPNPDEVRTWAHKLKGPRTDIRVALEVIGRRLKNKIALERAAEVRGSTVGYRLDLRDTCLQGADIFELDFEHALLNGAQMQGPYLGGAQMQGADLGAAQMQGAILWGAQMDEKTSLIAAALRGAAMREVDYKDISLTQEQVDEMFGDGSVELPSALTRPDWPAETLDYLDFESQWRAWQVKIGTDPTEDAP
jgi:hypothetical protein